MDEITYLKNKIKIKDNDLSSFLEWTSLVGIDKCIEIYKNYINILNVTKPDFESLYTFYKYDIELSEILFTLLRHSENHIKAFLCNVFNNYPVQIEERPSNYTKTKYYLKIPVGVNKYLDIRTHNYKKGTVDYYDAIKTIDFGDLNLIMFHLPKEIILKFSTNENILDELDKTRQLRNYVYHHNMLFSLGEDELKLAINLVINNLPNEELETNYKNKINALRTKENSGYALKLN